jgi:uncharacterized protein involved in response to NO
MPEWAVRTPSPTPPFVWTAATLAIVAGFGLGGALFGALFGPRPGLWWPAAAQAHGHAQLFGWAGLMVLGVGLHFLPRLRGAALAAPGLAPWVLVLFGGGVALRAVAQPLAAARPGLMALLPLAALLELAGATIAVGMLVATSRRAVPLRERAGMRPVLPFVALAFGSLWLSLLLNLLGWTLALGSGLPLLTAPWELLVVHLALVGFLTPVSLAVAVRTFPLYLRVEVPGARALGLVLAVLGVGLGLRVLDALGAPPPLDSLGRLLEGAALLAATWVVDAPLFRTRAAVLARAQAHQRELGQAPRPWPPLSSDLVAAEWLLRTAYAWLAVAGALLLLGGALGLGGGPLLPADVERHALGTGFVTLLIFGMGPRLLPGFVGSAHVASAGLVWATVWLGNAAALLRVAPPLVVWLLALTVPVATPPAALTNGLLALSGLLGLAAVACFTANLWRTLR